MKKIKNLIILYPSFEKGGATENLINFINNSVNKDIKIYLITKINNKDKNRFLKKNIHFFNIKSNIKIRSLNRLITSINSIFILSTLLKNIKNDNSLVFSFQSHIFPIIVTKILNRKIILRNSEDIYDATKYADYRISALFIYLLKILFYNFSDGIITNAKKAKNSLDKILTKKKAKLIYNPYLKSIYKGSNIKRKKIILSVGRLCKQKNQEITVKAFAHFLKKFPDYKLIIIGHGGDEYKLKQLCLKLNISKKVIFKGWIKNLKKYYLESKILIFPSLYEGLPNTLIEAVNYNLPCISSRCSGAVDILSEKYGTFTTYDDPLFLSKKMSDSVTHYKVAFSNGQKIKKKLSRFLIKAQVLKYISYCNSILD